MNIYNLPLKGKIIIESSAGTGKTHIIELIYLRLILGINNKKLNMNNILILTLNKKQIEKIKFNILKKIKKIKEIYIKNKINFSKNSIHKELLFFIENKKKTTQILTETEKNIHEAPIYTIDDFCKLILKNNTFKLNLPIEQSIIKNEIKIQKEACEDYWIKNYYPMNYSISKVIFNEWKTPKKLFENIKPFLTEKIPIFILKNEEKNIKKKHNKLIKKIKKIKKIWISNFEQSKKYITNSNINKHIYNKRNLSNWFKKIKQWAESKTTNYEIPKEIKYFSQNQLIKKTKIGNPPKNFLFLIIEKFLDKKYTIKDILIYHSIINSKKIIDKKKKEEKKLNSENLLQYLNNIIKKNRKKKTVYSIFNKYKVAIIDESQEIKTQQNEIFQKIYKKKNCLILIGDLQQAIGKHNNENIFNYIKMKKNIKKQYTFKKNWRSSTGITQAINKIFKQKKNPFLIKQIKFKPFKYNKKRENIVLIHKEKKVSSLNLFILKNNTSYLEYKKKMAYKCAKQIYDWIISGKKKKTWIFKKKKKFIKHSDIAVLVRNETEALIIKKSLKKFKINSNFIYNKKNIFCSNEALEILLILKAVIEPNNGNLLRSALTTSLINLKLSEINILNKNEKKLEKKIEQFNEYLSIWNKFGILTALRKIIITEKIDYNLFFDKTNGEQRFINIIHISELLQEKEIKLISKTNIISWLNKQIQKPNLFSKKQKIKEKKNKNAIRISTIYQSKGSEYPIVWIPFDYYSIKNNIKTFHNRKNFKMYLDLTENKKNKKLAEEEYLSQNIRLLYVALTRSKYHCSIGITPIIKENKKKIAYKSIFLSLLQNKKNDTPYSILKKIQDNNINIKKIEKIKIKEEKIENKSPFIKREIKFKINDNWKITNYTDLINKKYHSKKNTIIKNKKIKKNQKTKKNINDFPRGIKSGIFFHSILQEISFNKKPNKKIIIEKLKKYNFSQDWVSIIQKCLINILNIPLIKNDLKLSKIKSEKKIKEMKFYISIKKTLNISKLENIIKKHDTKFKKIKFQSFKGILNGSIDLIFHWKKKIYLVDYKSNWLGEKISNYNLKSLKNIIFKKRYNLQYQIYTLAVHRFFKKKIENYNYNKNFGGVFYIFIRGCDIKKPKYGIYYTIPNYSLIKNLDKIFK